MVTCKNCGKTNQCGCKVCIEQQNAECIWNWRANEPSPSCANCGAVLSEDEELRKSNLDKKEEELFKETYEGINELIKNTTRCRLDANASVFLRNQIRKALEWQNGNSIVTQPLYDTWNNEEDEVWNNY